MSDERLPERYRSYLKYLARQLLRTAGRVQHKIDASDLVQDVLLQAHVARPQFKGTTEAELRAWLKTILANKFADEIRRLTRQKRDAALEEAYRETLDDSASRLRRMIPAQRPSPMQELELHERELPVAEALEHLPEDQRTAVELRHLWEYSLAESAEEMGRTRASVAGLLRRGLKSLREDPALKGLE